MDLQSKIDSFTPACVMYIKANIVVLQIALAVVLIPSLAHAAISNGASAINVLGQYDDSLTAPGPVYTKRTANNGPNKLGLNAPYDTAIDVERHLLFVTDTSNNRVLVFNLDADHALVDRIPDYVLGQQNFYSNATATTIDGMSAPVGLVVDTDHDYFFVADYTNNRILVYDLSSLSSGMDASYVLGQNTFTSSTAATTQEGLRNPYYVAYTGSTLFVADSSNNRVLVFSGAITTGMSAWRVLGQSNFTSSGSATTQSGFSNPRGLAYDTVGNRLFISEYNNNRVLVFSGSALTNGMNAAKVLGQAIFTTATTATSQAGMWNPGGLAYGSGSHLYVADTNNYRVQIYDVASISDGENAENVLGQSIFTTRTAATTQAGFNGPRSATLDPVSGRLYVGQVLGNRVSVFDVASIADGGAAVDLVGQYDDSVSDPQPVYTKSGADNGPNKFGFSILSGNLPNSLAIDPENHRLFVADGLNNRVLVYDMTSGHELVDRIPDYVLGQTNFYTRGAATTQAGLSLPSGLAYDTEEDRLFVVESTNRRVLVFSGGSLATGMNANHVLGQSSYTAAVSAATQRGFVNPQGITIDSTQQNLYVADVSGNRVMVYDVSTIANGQSGAYVLGQSTFTGATSATTVTGMSQPRALTIDTEGSRLFVGDRSNNRTLVFDVSTITNGEAAIHVLGQSSFVTATSGTTASSQWFPRGISYDAEYDRLFVGDLGNQRVLVYDVASISDGEAAVHVLGQVSMTTIQGLTQASASNMEASSVLYDPVTERLYVSDVSFNRILSFDVAPQVAASSSSSSSSVARTQSGGGRRGSPGRGGIAPEIDTSRWRVSDSSLKNSASDEEPSTSGDTFSFRDVPNTAWFYDAVHDLASRKIISGYADSQGRPLDLFGSADPVTIGQILKIALLGANYQLPVPSGVPRNRTATDWSAPYVALAESLQFTLASENVSLPATRGQVIRLLMEAADIDVSAATSNPFSDLDSSDPNTPYILKALELGIVTGDTHADGSSTQTVRPGDMINRAEVAVLVMRFIRMSLAQ